MAPQWQRVGDGYELATSHVIYRVQRRTSLSDAQKWALDRHLGLRPRDGKRREAWVILYNGTPTQQSYSKATAMQDINVAVAQALLQRSRTPRPSSPGIALSLSQHHLPPDPEPSVISRREDSRALSEHLPESRRRSFGSRRRSRSKRP
jgi:hypothetical protein